MTFNKEHAIIAQNSGTVAAALISAAGVSPNTDIKGLFDEVRQHVFEGTLALAGAETVVRAFESPTSVADAIPTYPEAARAERPPFPDDTRPAYNGGGGYSGGGGGNSSGAGSVVLKFGKHKGKTIAQVAQEDAGWLDWAGQNTNNQFVKDKIREFQAA